MIFEVLVIILVIGLCIKFSMQLYHKEGYMKNVQSMRPVLPLIGTGYGMVGKSATEGYIEFLDFAKENNTPVKDYLGTILFIYLDKPDDVKAILSSPDCLGKSFLYDLSPFKDTIFSATSKCRSFSHLKF